MRHKQFDDLGSKARAILHNNDRGSWTVPAGDLYPHQWLWDSCFIAIGLRHIDVERAKKEVISLTRGQWSNGMLPNIIFWEPHQHRRHVDMWKSSVNPFSPQGLATSGVTQPPMLAEAVVKIGEKLASDARLEWYRQMFPSLLHYHEWLYTDRDPHHTGLVVLLHPYESGLDNSPPWISELRKHSMPLWIEWMERLHVDGAINLVRRDTRHVPPGQRMSNIEAMAYWAAVQRLKRKAYNTEAILSRSLFAVEDLAFNCILVRANKYLRQMAMEIGHTLPPELESSIDKTEQAIEELWDEASGYYFSRSFAGHKLIGEPTIATLLPLYAGSVSKSRAKYLANLLADPNKFGAKSPIPSVPLNSDYFSATKYWQGPTWINTNWLIIEGLKNYGFAEEAANLERQSLELVSANGMNEYFNPLTGEPAGAANFSWTAALTIDLLN
jgi:hypothetical protein